MEHKEFMSTKGNITVGVVFDRKARTAHRVNFTSDYAETRASSLQALITQIKKVDFTKEENIQEPREYFVNQSLHKDIVNGYYKTWILTGKTKEGTIISEGERNLWIEFAKLYSANMLFISIRNTHDARISDNLLKMKGRRSSRGNIITFTPDQLENNKYSAYCWDELNKIVNVGIDVTEEQ